jgi:hypothetical protein
MSGASYTPRADGWPPAITRDPLRHGTCLELDTPAAEQVPYYGPLGRRLAWQVSPGIGEV